MNVVNGFPTPQKDYYKVYVNTCTFNQAPYIEDCLNGVAMQETNFPFLHHVIDDASTDGEQNVIKAWMDKNCDMEHAEYYDNDLCTITLVKNKKNPNCTLAAYFLKKNMYGNPKKVELFTPWREVCPYEALCEGDDYWRDPLKLQKQVDILERDHNIGLVYTKAQQFEQNAQCFTGVWGEPTQYEDMLLRGNNIPTLTIMFRQSVAEKHFIDKAKEPTWPLGDEPLDFYFFKHSKVYFIDEITSVYRVLSESASHSKTSKGRLLFKAGAHKCRVFYMKKYWMNSYRIDLLKQLFRYGRNITKSNIMKFFYFEFSSVRFVMDNIYKYKLKSLDR